MQPAGAVRRRLTGTSPFNVFYAILDRYEMNAAPECVVIAAVVVESRGFGGCVDRNREGRWA